MNTIQIIKRSLIAACAIVTIGLASIQPVSAGVTPNDAPIVQPLVGDGQETHGGKG